MFKHQPLPFHARALAAHLAAEAARRQGRFWEYHDRLMAAQDRLDDETLERHARELGLDPARFRRDRDDPAVYRRVLDDREAGLRAGARGTPSFVVNGVLQLGELPPAEFKALIDRELAHAATLVARGVAPARVHDEIMKSALPEQPGGPMAPRRIDPGAAPALGPADAPVTIVHFASFQDPYCRATAAALDQLRRELGERVRVVFKHHPQRFHLDAAVAHVAAQAAHEQGRFWEFHDRVFAAPAQLDRATLDGYARDLGLDAARFAEAIDSGRARDAVLAELAAVRELRMDTPTLYVNERRLAGARPVEHLRAVVQTELARASATR